MVGIQANGATPITHTLREAITQELSAISGPKSIILVSDGKETCDDDPCDVARLLARSGIDLKIDVIGFGVHDVATEQQLKCISAATLGQYTQAETYADLSRQLQNARAAIVEERVEGRVMMPGTSYSGQFQPTSQTLPPPTSASPTSPMLPDMESLIPSTSPKPAPKAINPKAIKKNPSPPPKPLPSRVPSRLPSISR
jgi:hypothetical protein